MNIKRIFDTTVATVLLLLLSGPMLIIALIVKGSSPGPLFFWSDRVGMDNQIFRMPKFRTMRTDAPVVATHLMKNPGDYLTPAGFYLRKFSLDEFPQLWCILKGDMSFVGPRPALYNQDDLIALRTARGVHEILPGVTGWAQINGRDDLPIPQKVGYDEYYLQNRSFLFDLQILYRTVFKVIKAESVHH